MPSWCSLLIILLYFFKSLSKAGSLGGWEEEGPGLEGPGVSSSNRFRCSSVVLLVVFFWSFSYFFSSPFLCLFQRVYFSFLLILLLSLFPGRQIAVVLLAPPFLSVHLRGVLCVLYLRVTL